MTADEIIDEEFTKAGASKETLEYSIRETDALCPETIHCRHDQLHPEEEAILRAVCRAVLAADRNKMLAICNRDLEARQKQAEAN